MDMMYVYTLKYGLYVTERWVTGSPASIREVQDSNVDRETIYRDWNFYVFFSHFGKVLGQQITKVRISVWSCSQSDKNSTVFNFL
jgi:hypothetical protein